MNDFPGIRRGFLFLSVTHYYTLLMDFPMKIVKFVNYSTKTTYVL